MRTTPNADASERLDEADWRSSHLRDARARRFKPLSLSPSVSLHLGLGPCSMDSAVVVDVVVVVVVSVRHEMIRSSEWCRVIRPPGTPTAHRSGRIAQ